MKMLGLIIAAQAARNAMDLAIIQYEVDGSFSRLVQCEDRFCSWERAFKALARASRGRS